MRTRGSLVFERMETPLSQGERAVTILEKKPLTLPVPLREEPQGVLRVGKTGVLLELVIHAYEQGESPAMGPINDLGSPALLVMGLRIYKVAPGLIRPTAAYSWSLVWSRLICSMLRREAASTKLCSTIRA